MTDTRKIQYETAVDATGAVAGFDKVKDAAKSVGPALEQAGQQGAKGMDAIAGGAADAAQKVERAGRDLIGSIQRTTAAQLAGERGTAKYFETLGQQRGISGDILAPYLDKLRAVEQAQKAATGSLETMGVSAKQTAAALRGVPAQFTDIVTSLQGGQAPLTVFLQQGGQLKDMFGGAGNAARALGGYVLGLVNPFTLAAVGVAGLAYAYSQGAAEAQAFRKTLIETGGAAGVTVSQLSASAEAVSRFAGTQGKAAESINQLAAAGIAGTASLERYAAAAIGWERAGAAAAETTNKAFAELGKAPVQASIKLNESMNYLTRSTYEHIKALDEQGRHTEAAQAAQEAFAASLEQRTPALLKNLGYVERAWLGIKDAVTGVGSAIAGIGREQTDADSLKALQSQLAARQERNASVGIKDGKATEALQQQINLLARRVLLTQEAAAAEGLRTNQVKAGIEWDKQGEQFLTKAERLQRDITAARNEGVAAGRSQEEIEKRIAAIREKAGPATGEAEIAALRAKIRETDLYLGKLRSITDYTKAQAVESAKLNEGEKLAVELQEKLRGSIVGTTRAVVERQLVLAKEYGDKLRTVSLEEAQQKAIKNTVDEYDKLIAGVNKSAQSIEEQASKQEAANAVYGQGKTAIEAMTLAQLKHQMAEADSSDRFDPRYIASLEAKIKAQERFVAALQGADFKTLQQGLADYLQRIEDANRISEEEASMAGLTALERAKIVAQRRAELELARQLAIIDKANLDDTKKEALRSDARAAAERAAETGISKAIRDDATRTADIVYSSLADALTRGFSDGENAAKNFRDTVTGLINNLVLKPQIEVQLKELGGKLSKSDLATLGDLATFADIASSASAGKWGQAAGQAIGAYVGGPLGSAIGKAAGAFIDKLFSGDAGTPHTGGSSSFSGATGLSTGAGVAGVGSKAGFYSSEAEALTTQLAKGIVGILDTTAVTFGKAAGFAAATGFADDTSKDGAWGALVIKQMDKTLTDWDQNRQNKHTPREFADGQAGVDQYIAAVIKDTRAALEGIGLPDWARSMLDAIGASPGIDQFGEVVDQINAIQNAMISFGRVMPQIAGLSGNAVAALVQTFGGAEAFTQAGSAYYEQFYTDAQKTANVTSGLTKALGDLGLSLPGTREAYRGLVEAQDLTTEAGRSTYTALLKLSPAFASIVAATEQLTGAADESAQAVAEAAKQMAEAGRRALADLSGQRGTLEVDLLRAQGKTGEADALARQRALAKLTEGLSATDIAAATALEAYNQALRDQIAGLNAATAAQQEAAARQQAIDNERFGLLGQLLQLQGDTAALRTRELASLDASNRALMQSIYALEDQKAAAEQAAQALQRVNDVMAGLGNVRFDLENQILGLQGNDTEVARRTRERDLAEQTKGLSAEDAAKVTAAYDYNVALRQQIAAMEEARRAAEQQAQAQAQAAEDSARAAEQFKSAWQSVADSLVSEVARIRGLTLGASPQSFAGAQAQFAVATAQARAGDQEAAKLLPGLSQTLLTLAEANATTLVELQRIRAQTAASLGGTAAQLASQFGLNLPKFAGGTDYVPRDMAVVVHEGERIVPKAFNPAIGAGAGVNSELVAEMRAMRSQLTDLQTSAASTAANTKKSTDVLVNVTEGGRAMQTEAADA